MNAYNHHHLLHYQKQRDHQYYRCDHHNYSDTTITKINLLLLLLHHHRHHYHHHHHHHQKNRYHLTCWNEVSFRVCGPLSIIWCSGSNTANIPLTFPSPKYKRDASSRPSCHSSCQRIATRINSSLTCKGRPNQVYWL